MTESDEFKKWTWWWQPEGAADDFNRSRLNAAELVKRALDLRQNLQRGEHAPVIPRSHPGEHTTPSEAEAFLLSRPWFVFGLEVAEERKRLRRLEMSDWDRYEYSPRAQVVKWWKERGDWRDEFDKHDVIAWKWRHESPSPEPEDLSPVDNMKETPLEVAEEMKFTPSEIEELETIELPESEQPEGFWVIEQSDMPPHFPGQMVDLAGTARKRWEEERRHREAQGIQSPFPVYQGIFHNLPDPRLAQQAPDDQSASSYHEEEEHDADISESEGESDNHSPRKGRHRPDQKAASADGIQDHEHSQTTPRRSARIAAMKRKAEPMSSDSEPNKRVKRNRAAKTTAPVSQPAKQETGPQEVQPGPAREAKTDTRPKHRRGRSNKDTNACVSSATKEVTKTPRPARRQRGPKKNT